MGTAGDEKEEGAAPGLTWGSIYYASRPATVPDFRQHALLEIPCRTLKLQKQVEVVLTMRTISKLLPLVSALALTTFPGTALARGGHGGGASGSSHGGGHTGGGGHSYAGVSHFGGRYGSHLYLGPRGFWGGRAHWGSGFWAWGGSAWVAYPGRWWVSPAYPGWVWMGEPWVWDGAQWVSQDGYWTTADMPQADLQEPAVEVSTEPPPVPGPLLPVGPPPAGPPPGVAAEDP
jgi:hypothetical protein